MNKKLFSNRKTESNIERLACIAYHYDKRGETSIGLDLLKAAKICSPTDEYNHSTYFKIQSYTQKLLDVGFITMISKSYRPGQYSRKYRVNKETVMNYYGEFRVNSYKKVLMDLYQKDSPESFIEQLESMKEESIVEDSIRYDIVSPGKIVFYKNDCRINTLEYFNLFGKQNIQIKSFHGSIQAVIDLISSIEFSKIPEDVSNMIQFINDGEQEVFKKEFDIHYSVSFTDSKKSFTIHKSSRAYSGFCSYKKDNGDRDSVLRANNLPNYFDIKSCVPRLTYFINHGVWLNNSIDIYKMIYDESKLSNEWTDSFREHIKQSFMMMYFVEQTNKSYFAYKNANKGNIILNEKEYISLFEATRYIIGKTLGPSIFYYESILETNIVHHFKKEGYRITNIYDGFYFEDKLSSADVEAYIAECATNCI